MLSDNQVADTVTEYTNRLSTGTSAEIAALYAEDATVEDPVGGEVRVGREAITALYSGLDGVDTKAELLTLRIAGNSAAFHMRVTTTGAERTTTIEPIDVMTVDARGQITCLRAYWAIGDVVIG